MSTQCFFYLNVAYISIGSIVKAGIANNPDKRISAFNCGIMHRSVKGYCEQTKFHRAFTIRFPNRKAAIKFEGRFKKKNKKYLLSQYGSEVFNLELVEAVERLP